MSKLTYSEQLKHPNWQRKRLEMLNAAGFKCEQCGDAENTLHVHHKHYIKNRQVWEYENSDLVVLCENCHELAHETSDRFKEFVAKLPIDGPCSLDEVFAIASGYCDGHSGLDFSTKYESSPYNFALGKLAFILQFACKMDDLLLLYGLLSNRCHAEKQEAIKEFIQILEGTENA